MKNVDFVLILLFVVIVIAITCENNPSNVTVESTMPLVRGTTWELVDPVGNSIYVGTVVTVAGDYIRFNDDYRLIGIER